MAVVIATRDNIFGCWTGYFNPRCLPYCSRNLVVAVSIFRVVTFFAAVSESDNFWGDWYFSSYHWYMGDKSFFAGAILEAGFQSC